MLVWCVRCTQLNANEYTGVLLMEKSKCYQDMECSCSHNGMQVDAKECCCWQDQDVIMTRECCCEPIKMNIAAMVICTICTGWKQNFRLTYRLCLFVGGGSNSICCKISNFLFNISKNLKFFWEYKDLEILINTGCFLPCTI